MARIADSFFVGSWIACEVTPSVEKGTRSSYESGSEVISRYFHEELPIMAAVVRDLKVDPERRYELEIQFVRPGGSGGMHGRVMYVLPTEEELRATFADHPAKADAYIEIRQRLLRTDENRVVAEGEVIREFERFLSNGHLEEEYRRL